MKYLKQDDIYKISYKDADPSFVKVVVQSEQGVVLCCLDEDYEGGLLTFNLVSEEEIADLIAKRMKK